MGLDRAIDITAEQRKTVLALLERHLPNTTAWVYGSRAQWAARPQSDLNMVVFATPEHNSRVSDLREAFEESNLPFRVDLFVWDAVPEQFRKQIKRDHVVLAAGDSRKLEGKKSGAPGEWAHCTLADACSAIKREVRSGETVAASRAAAARGFKSHDGLDVPRDRTLGSHPAHRRG